MSSCKLAIGGMVALAFACASPSWGQRIQFPTTARGQLVQQATPVPTLNGAPYTPPGGFAPNTGAPTYTTPAPTYTTPAPTYSTPTYTSPPAALQGTVTPAPGWDPYVDPSAMPSGTPYYQPQQGYATQPPALFPSDGGPSVFTPGGYAYTRPDGTMGQWPRLFQEIRAEYTWLAKLDDSDDSLGINTVAASGTMAFPFFYDQAPLLVTPGGAIHFLDGPVTSAATGFADLPPRLYDLYLDTAWKPVLTPWLSADLGFRAGVYSDFEHLTSDSVRLMGRGLGILTFSPTTRIALGAVYLDRLDVKFLPAGGVIWTPNEDTRFEILFPNPKLAKRFTTLGTTEWWWYVAGEYGLGSWTIDRADGMGDRIDINDLRVIGGLEWFTLSGMRGVIEAGYVFDRKVLYQSGAPDSFDPPDTIMLRAGLAY